MAKPPTVTITQEQLLRAMCARHSTAGPVEPCGAHRAAAEKIWTKLEEST